MSVTTRERTERRVRPLASSDFHLRAAAAGGMPGFTGHAAVFDTRTAIGNPLKWGFYEEVAPGAFTKTLSEGDARFLVDHDTAMLVARVSAGDLRLAEDEVGLDTAADLDTELSYVRDLVRNLERRRITGMSFGFDVVKDDWTAETVETSDGQSVEVEVRRILEVRLWEVSCVTFPAYDETDAALRAVQHRSQPDPFGRRGTLLHPSEPAETTRNEETSQPAETTGTPLTLAKRRHGLLAARYGLA